MKENILKKVAVITGGNKGIGEAIVGAFLKEGYFVVVGARTVPKNIIKNENFLFCQMDVRKEEHHNRLVSCSLKWKNRLDVYVNCAGFSRWSPIQEVDESFWNSMIDTNLKGTFWGCKTAAQHLSNGGVIINIGSIAGKRGSVNNAVYCASKFGVTGITQALAKELGPRGIRVNAVCPVLVLTEGLQEALEQQFSPAYGKKVQEFLQNFTQEQTALKRLPTAQEIGDVCVFLASDKASAITGQSINVDCGVFPQ